MTASDPSRVTLVLGGARSGKSSFAEQLAKRSDAPVVYVATATADDDEIAARIAAHREARPRDWQTVEARRNVASALGAFPPTRYTVLLDCLTLLATNVLLDEEQVSGQKTLLLARAEAALSDELEALLGVVARRQTHLIVVSNEVGSGIVPPYPLGRIFQDLLGRANQRLAQTADEVYLLVAGLPVPVKRLAQPPG